MRKIFNYFLTSKLNNNATVHHFINKPLKKRMSVAVAWSVDTLPSNPAARVRFPGESGILISILGLGVSFVFCPVLSLVVALTFC